MAILPGGKKSGCNNKVTVSLRSPGLSLYYYSYKSVDRDNALDWQPYSEPNVHFELWLFRFDFSIFRRVPYPQTLFIKWSPRSCLWGSHVTKWKDTSFRVSRQMVADHTITLDSEYRHGN